MATKKKSTRTKSKKQSRKKTTSTKSKASSKKQTNKKVVQKKKLSKPSSSKVSVGDILPDFLLDATSEKKVSPASLKGKNVVLYFYPKDNTPGCTLEGHDFTKLQKEFEKYNTVIYGVSRDSVKSHEGFKSKQCYTFDLISDPEEVLCRIFGVIKLKNMYGREVLGIDRSTFLIDVNGVLKKEWRGVKVKGHAEDVLTHVKDLSA